MEDEVESVSYDKSTLCVEYAKSNRSECKVCGKNIEKDKLRVGHIIYFDPDHVIKNQKWCHPECIQKYQKLYEKMKFYEFEGSDQIKDKDKQQIIKLFKIPEGDQSDVPKPKFVPLNNTVSDKFEDQQTFDLGQFQKFVKFKKSFESLNYKQLQELLAKNLMFCSGNKDKLVDIAAECKILGSRPTYCPQCGGTNLRFNIKKGTYRCTGFLEDIDWYKCDYYQEIQDSDAPKRRAFIE